MNSKLKYGVVGVGHLGSIHARLLSHIDEVDVVGVYDRDTATTARVATELGMEAFDDYDRLLGMCDVVSIVTPTSNHFESAARAIDSGVHVFIEKPITATHAEAIDLMSRAAAKGVRVGVGHIERFNPVFAALGGFQIRPLFIESHRLAQFKPRATDVAVVLDLMIHDIDLLLTLVGREVIEVRSSGVSIVSDELDIANARIEFEGGCVANVTASRISQRPMRKMRIFQSDAYLSIDFAEPSVEVFRLAGRGEEDAAGLLGQIGEGSRAKSISYSRPEIQKSNALEDELRDFIAAVCDGREPRVTGTAAAEALRVAEEVIREIDRRNTPSSPMK